MFPHLGALFVAMLLGVSAYADDSKQIVTREFYDNGKAPSLTHRKDRLALEICRDTCDYYTARISTPETIFWDIVFLQQLYFNTDIATERFRTRYLADGEVVMSQHKSECPSLKDKALAKCVLDNLSKQ